MTFSPIETSRRKGEPVTLYLFIYGGDEGDSPTPLYYGYTDAEQAITYDGFTYSPVPVARDAIASTGNLDKVALTVRFPRDIEFAEDFRVYPPTQITTLIIRQGHLSDADSPPEFLVCWTGRVLSLGREADQCVVTGEPIASSLRRPGLRRHYQIGCPHALYSQGTGMCNASKAAGTVVGTVASISGTTVTLNAGWNGILDPSKFVTGQIEWTNTSGQMEIRRILWISGNTLALGGVLRDLVATMAINVILGCNHQTNDCQFVHNNILNFGGFPWIPSKNPIGFRNQFY